MKKGLGSKSAAEKAGVGGSTPSLATIIIKDLAESRLALPVRSQSAIFRRDPVRFLATVMMKNLKIELPLAQSAFSPLLSAAWLKIAVSIAPAAAMRSSLTRRDMEHLPNRLCALPSIPPFTTRSSDSGQLEQHRHAYKPHQLSSCPAVS